MISSVRESKKMPIAFRPKRRNGMLFPTLLLFALILSVTGCSGIRRDADDPSWNNGDGERKSYVYEYSIPWNKVGGKPESGKFGVTSQFLGSGGLSVTPPASLLPESVFEDYVATARLDMPSKWFTLTLSESGSGGISSGPNINRSVEWNFGTYKRIYSVIDENNNTIGKTFFPRLIKLQNGDLLMFFQDEASDQSKRKPSNILYMRSTNGGKTWRKAKYLVKSEDRKHEYQGNTYPYTGYHEKADVIQLSNGWLIAAYSFMAADPDLVVGSSHPAGLAVKISKDNGYTWSDEILACKKASFEPSLLELPPQPGKGYGEIQLFYREKDGESDGWVAMVRSYDGGQTWTPVVDDSPLSTGIRIARNGEFSGMPSAFLAGDGREIGVAFAERDIWMVWSSLERNWDYNDFDADGNGPWARRFKVFDDGHDPYVIRMETGETLLSFTRRSNPYSGMNVMVGDGDGRNFGEPSLPFPVMVELFDLPYPFDGSFAIGGYMGRVCAKDNDTLIAVATALHSDPDTNPDIAYVEGYLIRDFDVPKGNVNPDNSLDEAVWKNGRFLYMGSHSTLNCYVRFAYNDDNLYVSVDTNDDSGTKASGSKGWKLSIYLDVRNGKSETVGEGVYRLDITPGGVAVMKSDAFGNWTEVGN